MRSTFRGPRRLTGLEGPIRLPSRFLVMPGSASAASKTSRTRPIDRTSVGWIEATSPIAAGGAATSRPASVRVLLRRASTMA